MKKRKKVFVSGCFDIFHSGHIAFLKSAASYGDLYVAIGSDKNIKLLKNKPPIFGEKERLNIVSSLSFVKKAFIAKGSGITDFSDELKKIKPDFFVVNKDGDSGLKRELCRTTKTKYIILRRKPLPGLPKRSTTKLISAIKFH
jgi:cytidyltransferase-like protein